MELHFLMIFKWMRLWVFLTTWKYLNNFNYFNRQQIRHTDHPATLHMKLSETNVLCIWAICNFKSKGFLVFKKGASDGLSFFLFFFYTLNIFYVSVRQKYSVKSFSMFSVTVLFHSGHDCLKHGSFSALLLVNSHFLSFLLFQQLLSVPRL